MWLNVGVKGKRLDMKERGGNQEKLDLGVEG
jgi:hypothetical protein